MIEFIKNYFKIPEMQITPGQRDLMALIILGGFVVITGIGIGIYCLISKIKDIKNNRRK